MPLPDATVAAGEAAIARGSQSFAAAARLFDRRTRAGAVTLYAWCRHCDDVIDGQALGHGGAALAADDAEARLAALEAETRSVLSGGEPRDPAFAGLAWTMRRHSIPAELPLAHLEGFRMDVRGRRYRTIEDTLDYSYHVAGIVGLMMGHVMGVRDARTLDRAVDLGLAFQLTNIARDIVPDAEVGRIYLPEDWLAEAGIPRDEIATPRHRAALAEVAGRLVDLAEPYYASALTGIAGLPFRAAWAIAIARGVYRAIGTEVKRRGPAAWDERVSTSAMRKLAFVPGGAVTALVRPRRTAPRSTELWRRPI